MIVDINCIRICFIIMRGEEHGPTTWPNQSRLGGKLGCQSCLKICLSVLLVTRRRQCWPWVIWTTMFMTRHLPFILPLLACFCRRWWQRRRTCPCVSVRWATITDGFVAKPQLPNVHRLGHRADRSSPASPRMGWHFSCFSWSVLHQKSWQCLVDLVRMFWNQSARRSACSRQESRPQISGAFIQKKNRPKWKLGSKGVGRIRLRVFCCQLMTPPLRKVILVSALCFSRDAFLTVFPLHSSVVCFVLAFIYLFGRSFSSSGLSPGWFGLGAPRWCLVCWGKSVPQHSLFASPRLWRRWRHVTLGMECAVYCHCQVCHHETTPNTVAFVVVALAMEARHATWFQLDS